MTPVQALKTFIKYRILRVGKPNISVVVPHKVYGDSAYHTFIGYYDIQPTNKTGTHILAGRCGSKHNGRAMDVPLELVLIDVKTGVVEKIAETTSWCWQQGARQQFIKWGGKEAVLYNAIDSKGLKTIIYDPETKTEIATLPLATYCIDAQGAVVASLDFDGLQRNRPGYGYDYLPQPRDADPYIRIYDIESGNDQVIAQLEDILKINPHESMSAKGVRHYFNHLHFNSSTTRLMVFHIWEAFGKRYVRALTMNIDGSDICDVTGGTHVSHYWWLNDNELMFYGTDNTHGEGFHIYKQSGGYKRSLSEDMPCGDGHPSAYSGRPKLLVSDSLPSRIFDRDLWLYHIDMAKCIPLGHFRSPPEFSGEIRCDLHPRWSADGHCVLVDSAHEGYRQIVSVDVASASLF